MTAAKLTVAVRMYNVGFGDAFVVTVRKGRQAWRMIVDCGVHAQGQVRSLEESVNAIIGDLRTASRPGLRTSTSLWQPITTPITSQALRWTHGNKLRSTRSGFPLSRTPRTRMQRPCATRRRMPLPA